MTDEEWRWLAKQAERELRETAEMIFKSKNDYAWTMHNAKVSYFGCIRENNASPSGVCAKSAANDTECLCYGTHAVGMLDPILSNIYDFYGNVGTWVWDWYGFASKSGDSLGPEYGICKVVRGSHFFMYDADDFELRYCYPPDKGSGLIGARLVRTQDGWIDDKDIE